MKSFIFLTVLFLVAFMSKAQKSVLTPSNFLSKDVALIASVLDSDNNSHIIEAKAMRFKPMIVDRDSIYYDVEFPAFFPEGQERLKKFIGQNIIRPKNSKGETVLVRFMVERYGEISKVHVLASPADPMLSAEAIKVVKKMGSWNPARIQGIEVASYYVLPIKF